MSRDKGWEFLFGKRRESGSFYDDDGGEGYIYSDGSGYYHGADGSDGYIYSDGSGYFRGGDGSDGYKYSDGSGHFRGGNRNVDAYQYSDGSGYYEDKENAWQSYDSVDELEDSDDYYVRSESYSASCTSYGSSEKTAKKSEDKWSYLFLLVLFIGLFAFSGFMYHRSVEIEEQERQEHIARNELELPISAKELKGRHFEDVVFIFEKAGFTNFEFIIEDDIVTGWIWEDGEVELVQINGDEKFKKGEWQHKDSVIRIKYHTKKE